MGTIDKKLIFIVALLAILGGLTYAIFFSSEVTSFVIADKCGRFINLFSHTIETEETCELRCMQQCDAKDLAYKGVDFKGYEAQCNDCNCHCKEPLW